MRNLKKVFAVILAVAMLTTMMVPAFAGESNLENARALQKINLFAGEDDSVLNLDDSVTRIQGLAFAIRIAGLDDEALAMDIEEANELLKDFTDANEIPTTWPDNAAVKYAAYAVKEGIMVGTGNSLLAPMSTISCRSLLVFVLKGMGYADAKTVDVADLAVAAGLMNPSDIIGLLDNENLIREYAALILFNAASQGVNEDGTDTIEAYIADGGCTLEEAVAAGFAEELEPEEFEVKSVEALNLVQVEVVFNKDVDSETAEDENNYDVEDATVAYAELQEDGRTVILTLDAAVDQQAELDVEIEDVEDLDENAIDDVTFEDVYFLDTAMPEVVDVEIVGIDTIKVTFSEPVKADTGKTLKSTFEVRNADDDKLYVKSDGATGTRAVSLANTAIYVVLSSDLDDEESITLKVNSDMEDFAGFSVMPNSTEVDVVVDEDAPEVVDYKDAKPTSITLIFNEDITIIGGDPSGSELDDYYHTNSKSPAEDVELKNGNELVLTFDEDSELPEGTAYVYINEEVIADFWGNENDQIMVKVEIEEDDTDPVLEKIEVDAQDTIILTFSEDVTDVDRSDFTVYDEDEDEVSIKSVSVNGDEVTIVFREDLSGDYVIAIEKIEDLAGNKISKTTEEFTAEDKTTPVLDDDSDNCGDVSVKVYKAGTEDQMIKVDFGEKMATDGRYSVADPENYAFFDQSTGKFIDLTDMDEVEIDVVDGGEGVEIFIPYDDSDDDIDNPSIVAGTFASAKDKLVISRVADAGGNYTVALSTEKIIIAGDGAGSEIGIDKVELTAVNTIEITLDDKLTEFEDDDFVFTGLTADSIAKMQLKENKDGNTVIVVTIEEDSELLTGNYVDNEYYDGLTVGTEADADIGSENVYGIKLDGGLSGIQVADKVAPALVEDSDGNVLAYVADSDKNGAVDHIVLEYQEAINANYLDKYTYEIDDISITDVTYTDDASEILSWAENGHYVVIKLAADEDIPTDDTVWTPDVVQAKTIYDKANDNKLLAADQDIIETMDKAAPYMVSADVINATTIELVFAEDVEIIEEGANLIEATFDVLDDGGVKTFVIESVTVSGNVVTITLDESGTNPIIESADVIKVNYTADDADPEAYVQDKAGNALVDFTGTVVTNEL